jgi:hypothetical protein
MSCFGNLAPGAAEVQMPNESNSGVIIHPKSKHERSSALRVSALARALASASGWSYFENFTGTLFQLMPYRGTDLR